MTRLSIIVPLDGNVARMESSLVSVLENRPAACEILVVLNGEYADPYALEGEVRFVHAPCGASWATCMNLAAREAAGEFILPLSCGVEATEGFADTALEHFDDPRVAAVAPLIVQPQPSPSIFAAGTAYTAGGRRVVRGRGKPLSTVGGLARRSVSPTRCAGFYRRETFLHLGGFSPSVGTCADVDLGLRFEAAGLGAVFDSTSVLRASSGVRRSPGGFTAGLHAERLFLRNMNRAGILQSLAAHPFALLRGAFANVRRPVHGLGRLAGRLAAWCEWPRHAAHLQRASELAAAAAARPTRPFSVRADGSHALHAHSTVRTSLRRSAS